MPLGTLLLALLSNVPPPAPVEPVLSPAQLAWQELGCSALVSFNINTYTARDEGLGTERPIGFDPSEFDAAQWVKVLGDGGIRSMVVTAKHHDGFCLWPSATSQHTVAASSWRRGKGDILKDLAAACAAAGFGFGVDISPRDLHDSPDGPDAASDERCRALLAEIGKQYGPLFEVRFDPPTSGRLVVERPYNWSLFTVAVRAAQPDAVIVGDDGPDARRVPYAPDLAPHVGPMPGEVFVSIRPGNFWRNSETERVKSVRALVDLWFATVGQGYHLLLGVPADRRGLLPDHDADRLREFRAALDAVFRLDLARQAHVTASTTRGNDSQFAIAGALDDQPDTYWATDDGTSNATVEARFAHPQPVNIVSLGEFMPLGQRVERFTIEAEVDGRWSRVAEGGEIGTRRIVRFPAVLASAVRLRIDRAKSCPTLARFAIHCAPPEVTIEAKEEAFATSTTVTIGSDVPGASIHYTLDGSDPTESSPRYAGPFEVRQSTNVRAIAALEGARSLYPAGVQLTRFDAASFRNGIQLLVAPKPGLRLRRFDTALTTLDDLHEVAPADERVVADVALPKDRPGDNFALVFDGYLEVPQDGIYTFSLFSDDGSRLSIGGTQIVDRDGGAVWEQRQGRIALRAGWHLFHLTYFEAEGEERLRLRWSGPGFRDQPLPPSVFGH